MLEGRQVMQITKVWSSKPDGTRFSITIEKKHKVISFRQYLPPDENRKQALVQFIANPGGVRTVNAEDIIL